MKERNVENLSIGPDEALLRRIPNLRGYYDPQKAPPVGRGAFTPNQHDTDGLSVYLASEVSPYALVTAARMPAENYLVASLAAADIYSLGLSLVADPQPDDLPGHSLIPQINIDAYRDPAKKRGVKEAIAKLASLASRNIVWRPDD